MKRWMLGLVAAATVLGVGTYAPVNAQQPPAGGQMQDPLGLSPEQKTKMEAVQKKFQPLALKLQAKYQPKMQAIMKKYQAEGEKLAKDKSPAAQAKQKELFAKLQKEMKPIQDAAMKEAEPLQKSAEAEMNKILNKDQQAKLKALMAMQRQGGAGAPGGAPKR